VPDLLGRAAGTGLDREVRAGTGKNVGAAILRRSAQHAVNQRDRGLGWGLARRPRWVMNCPQGTSALSPLNPQDQTFDVALRATVLC